MFKIIRKRIIALIMILFILTGYIPTNISTAATIGDNTKLESQGKCRRNVEYKFSVGWSEVKIDYIAYVENGVKYPAYCILHGVDGVDEAGSYSVELTKILDDEQIYRCIVNGFPYKSASELGVENDYDAYFATKQAVNCVMLDRDVRACYRGKDEAGKKIVDAMEKMVDIARNGTQVYQEADVSVSQVGNLKEEGNFYTQEYSVSSDIQMSQYTISNAINMPTNSYIADTNLSAQTTFTAGNNFKVVIPKSSLTSNLNITFRVQTKCKSYPVFFGKTSKANTQDYAVTFDPYGDFVKTASLSANVNTGQIQITKIDADTSQPISGVVFQLLKTDGTQIATATTNANGIATFSNLYQDNYKIREISTTSNYILNSQLFDVSVEFNKTSYITIDNYHKKGNIKVIKLDSETNIPIANVGFNLLNSSGNVVASGTTNSNGELYFNNIRIGKYYLKEYTTDSNYILNTNSFEVNVEYNQTITKTITNNFKKGNIKILKTDSETSAPIEGVTFELYKTDDTLVGTATTNSNGEAFFNNIRIGDYTIKETSTNENYILNTNTFDVKVEYNKTSTKTIENEHKKGNLFVLKVDKDNNRIPLGNVIFDLYSEEFNKVVGTYTTDVNGELNINNIRTGNYKLIERNTGKWYNLAEDTPIIIEYNTTTNTLVENELKKGQVQVTKTDKEDNSIRLSGVVFEVLDENNKVLETIVTNSDGIAKTDRYAIRNYETLKLREIMTDKYYVLNSDITSVELKENETTEITIQNELKKGQIKVIKVDKDNNDIKLEGIEFNVYDEQNNIVDTLITDSNGEAISKKLPINQQYLVKEIKTLNDYVLNDEEQIVELEYDKIVDLTFTNELKKGKIKIIKVDKDNNDIKLEGVEFNIYDENQTLVDTITTDNNGEAISKELKVDKKYTIQESKTLSNYVLNTYAPALILKPSETTTITIENEKIKGFVEISKTDEITNAPLKGAIFGIYDMQNNEIQRLVTDELGKAKSSLIDIGKYYIKEVDPGSVYYLLNENIYEFEILNNHEIVPISITNIPVQISVNVEKTGYIETQKNDTIRYNFSNIANTSNIYLDSFKWKDYLPTEYIRLTEIVTGTWNQDITYSITYKTNLNNNEQILADKLNSKENYKINCTNIGLADNEYITEYSFNFGKVDIGFKEAISPSIFCVVLESVKDTDTFTNKTETIGTYHDLTDTASDEWTTIIYEKDLVAKDKTLPRTGK